jgi:hypothetical protein
VDGQHHALAAIPWGKTRYPLYRRLGGTQGRSERVRKISPSPGFDPRTVQPVASHYTDWAIPAPRTINTDVKLFVAKSRCGEGNLSCYAPTIMSIKEEQDKRTTQFAIIWAESPILHDGNLFITIKMLNSDGILSPSSWSSSSSSEPRWILSFDWVRLSLQQCFRRPMNLLVLDWRVLFNDIFSDKC